MSVTLEEQVKAFAEEFVADLAPIDAAQIIAPAVTPTPVQRPRFRPSWVAVVAAAVVFILFLPFLWPFNNQEPAEDPASTTVAPATTTVPPSTTVAPLSETLELQSLDAADWPVPDPGNIGVLNGQFVLVDPGLERVCFNIDCTGEPEGGWYQDLDDDTTAYLWSSGDGVEWTSEPLPDFVGNDWLWSHTHDDVLWILTEDATNRYANPTLWRRDRQESWDQVAFSEEIIWGNLRRLRAQVVAGESIVIPEGRDYWLSNDAGLSFVLVENPLALDPIDTLWDTGVWLTGWSEGFRVLVDQRTHFETWESSDGRSWSRSASGFGPRRMGEQIGAAAAGLTQDGRFVFGHRSGIWIESQQGSGEFELVFDEPIQELDRFITTDWGYLIDGEWSWWVSVDGQQWEQYGTTPIYGSRLVPNGDLLLDSGLRFVIRHKTPDSGS